ncbi:MAG: hypothetical protein LC794_07170 [Acidobacteria bacterium]|nr:hypothetical protein [Acidobacteriota bacterium]
MKRTINEQEFKTLCEEVAARASAILPSMPDGGGGAGPLNESESTGLLLRALFLCVCRHLELDPKAQASELGDDNGFALAQTLEEHMHPEFLYSRIIDECFNGQE